ncbi:hypothetical protein [Aeromonas dhakensis]|uniref:hypothetical protein n=1 Tax=Aeromonas dhakensis TaxID=196024 RepID=UPI00357179C8
MRLPRICTLALLINLGACGAGKTAATASPQARQTQLAQQQIDQANAANIHRLQQAR